MENSGIVTDCIYEDMSATSPLTDDGYMTASSRSMTSSSYPRLRIVASRGTAAGKCKAPQHPAPLSVYMNMDNPTRQPEATPSEQTRELLTCDATQVSRDEIATHEPTSHDNLREHPRDHHQILTRESSSNESSPNVRTPNYEYIDIEFPPPAEGINKDKPSSPPPPQLPLRNKCNPILVSRSPSVESSLMPASVSRDKLAEGLKSYQEQVRLQKEMMVNFSAAVLESNSIDALSSGNPSRTFMNSTV